MDQNSDKSPEGSQVGEVIELRGVRTNNLKGFDLDLPLKKLTVVTGVSGSGKSSLVFETIFSESYRRYVESLSSYARQYLQAVPKPSIKSANHLPPAISIRQVRSTGSSRSTVGTATEISELLRMIFAHGSELRCYGCGETVAKYGPSHILEAVWDEYQGKKLLITAPMETWREAWNASSTDQLVQYIGAQGFTRVLLDGKIFKISDLDIEDVFSVSIIVDRITLNEDNRSRFVDSTRAAQKLGRGQCSLITDQGSARSFSSKLHCLSCDISYPDPTPLIFSDHHPSGACPKCQGFGRESKLDWRKVIKSPDSSIRDKGVLPFNFGRAAAAYTKMTANAAKNGIDCSKSFSDFTANEWDWFMHGDGGRYQGVTGFFRWLDKKKYKAHYRMHAAKFRSYHRCSQCQGNRLKESSLAFRIGQDSIADVFRMTLENLEEWLGALSRKVEGKYDRKRTMILSDALAEAKQRAEYLTEIGVGYLSLDRNAATLSGGEFQRINMARCLSSALTETLFCIDEPSSGLHPQDSARLLSVLQAIRDRGNTVVVVEHEQELIDGADHLVEIGPGAGRDGGQLVCADSFDASCTTPSGRGSAMEAADPHNPTVSLKSGQSYFEIRRANLHNLGNVSVKFPIGRLTCICGVSGSGKSSLVRHCLYPLLEADQKQKNLREKDGSGEPSATLASIALSEGDQSGDQVGNDERGSLHWGKIDRPLPVYLVDQSPPGRSSRSNIATYLGIFEWIRKTFAEQPKAKALGLGPGAFSFNVAGGRCEACRGLGRVTEDLSFLGEVEVECPACEGMCFSAEVLSVRYKDRTLMDVLAMTVAEAREFFFDRKRVSQPLQKVLDLGMGYLTLGQSTSSFSGGEAQRLKLLRSLKDLDVQEPGVFILDEPTTGLSDLDVRNFLRQVDQLTDEGHTVIVVEHHHIVMRHAQWMVEMGPGAGPHGGQVVFQGPSEEVRKLDESPTGRFLRRAFPR